MTTLTKFKHFEKPLKRLKVDLQARTPSGRYRPGPASNVNVGVDADGTIWLLSKHEAIPIAPAQWGQITEAMIAMLAKKGK